jgi:hypothetical protein
MNYPDDPPAPPLHHCHHPLEIVTVCIDYADFLAETLPYNVQHCDRYVVITHPDDYKTRNVCKTHGVQCLLSKDANRHGHQFNKGRLIERALQHTSADGWRLHLDADIVLPARTRHYLKSAELEPDCIYGCDRLMVKSRGEWEKAKQSGVLTQHKWQSAMHYPPLQLGTRWGNESTGYVPIGFFPTVAQFGRFLGRHPHPAVPRQARQRMSVRRSVLVTLGPAATPALGRNCSVPFGIRAGEAWG